MTIYLWHESCIFKKYYDKGIAFMNKLFLMVYSLLSFINFVTAATEPGTP